MAAKKTKKSSRARRIGKGLVQGVRGTAVASGTGAVAYYAAAMASDKIQFCREKWWAIPGAMIAAGHFLKRKARFATPATVLCGLGGYVGVMMYKQGRAISAGREQSAAAAQFAAQSDAGMLMSPRPRVADTAALIDLEEQRRSRLGSALGLGR